MIRPNPKATSSAVTYSNTGKFDEAITVQLAINYDPDAPACN
jgi:hypothetical protein